MSTNKQSWPLMSLVPWSNKHSWELKAVMSMVPWVLISTHECSLCHCTILMSVYECSWAHMSTYESSWALIRVHECWTALLNNRQKMLTFEMIAPQYFANISVQISPNNKNLDIFKIYTNWAVEKYPTWNFYAPRKPRNSKNKSGYSIVGHPVR